MLFTFGKATSNREGKLEFSYKVKFVTVVEGNQKALFSIATTTLHLLTYPPSYGLNSTTTVLREGRICYYITQGGWCANKQITELGPIWCKPRKDNSHLKLFFGIWRVKCFFPVPPIHDYFPSHFLQYHHHNHHHIVPLARISLTISRHFSLSFIASDRSSGLHPVSSHSCWMYIRAGRPAFARPYVGVHRTTSLMSSSLLLQQCPGCLVHLTWIVKFLPYVAIEKHQSKEPFNLF